MNKVDKKTGAVVVAAPTDWLFAKGCLASLRWFMPELPVTLLIDGDVHSETAERTYGVQTMRKQDIPERWLQQNSFGWGFTKMAAAWYAPFERFLYLDSDTVVWGDLQAKVFDEGQDVVWSVPKPFAGNSRDYVEKWFFQPAWVEKRWPGFPWERYAAAYACTGTFSFRRGCLSLQHYRELVEAGRQHPHRFKFAEMGILNLMVFEALHAGLLRFKQADFQVIFPDHPQERLRQRFGFNEQQKPVVNLGDERVLHMPDQKPLVDNPDCYSDPMTFFRMRYLADTEGITGVQAMRRLRAEDAEYHRLRARFLRREKGKKIIGLLKGRPAEWRRVMCKLGLGSSAQAKCAIW